MEYGETLKPSLHFQYTAYHWNASYTQQSHKKQPKPHAVLSQ